jgi:glutamyl-tRNA reductase
VSNLFALGVSHKSAPVELRERLAIPDDDHAKVLGHLHDQAGLREVMVVSTCNRVEVYAVAPDQDAASTRAIEALARLHSIDVKLLREHSFVRSSADAARHIFRVAASLESLVVGEPQILGQVKEAFGRAKETGHVGPVLDRCLTLAFKSAKRVRTETEIARGGASVPSVAVDLAISIFGDLSDSTALLVGAGEMAEQAAVHLRAAGVPEIVVVNRSEERGRALAERVQGHYEPWERLAAQLTRADVVVSSTGSRMPIIVREQLKPVLKARRQRPLFFVDIAVPRDIEPAVGRMDHVFLYNVDDLQGIVHDNLRSRHGEAQRAGALVDEEVQAFLGWMRSRAIGPLIGKLQAHGRTIVDAEVERALAKLPELNERDREVVQKLGRSIMQKLLHQPMSNVRRAAADPIDGFDGPVLAEALAALFALQRRDDGAIDEAESRTAIEEAPEAKVVARPEPS